MSSLVGNTRRLIQLAFLVAVTIAAAAGVSQEADPVSASHTEIIFSYSNTEPIRASVIVAPGGAQAVYVWAVGVDDPTGVSGFQVEVTYDGSLLNIASVQPEPAWLASTGRTVSCSPPPVVEDNFLTLSCNTLTVGGWAAGPTGAGLLASISLNPQVSIGPATTLHLSGQATTNGSFLLSTPTNLTVQVMEPVTLKNSTLYVKCGDVNGDGIIDLFNDISLVIDHYGTRVGDPDWDPIYDMDGTGVIDLFNDIVAVIAQYGVRCTQP